MNMLKKCFLPALLLALMVFVCAQAEEIYVPDSFSFSGGTGRVTITCSGAWSEDGQTLAEIAFSSPNYAYVKVDGVEYPTVTDEKTSTAVIPVKVNQATQILAMTTAMSQPHEVAYTLFIRVDALAGDSALPSLAWESSLPLLYAQGFSVDFYQGGYALIDVKDGARYLVVPENMPVPEGLDPAIVTLRQPLDRIYLAATSAMALFDRIDALSCIRLSAVDADGWYVENARRALESGDMLFAGKYSEPSYETLLLEGCDLAIESTMILHAPKVQEMIELLGIPVFIDRSSYETHPLGRTEWIKLYGVLTGRLDQAEAFFDTQVDIVRSLAEYEPTGKTVAFFYISQDGKAVVRSSADYVPRMIEMAGGEYVFSDLTGGGDTHRSSVSVTMEDFFAAAVDADYLIYNGDIDAGVASLDQLLAKSDLLTRFKAVKENHVYVSGSYLYQATDIVAEFISDVRGILTGEDDELTFLTRLE